MTKTTYISSVITLSTALLLIGLLAGAQAAYAISANATSVESSSLGTQKDGDPIDPSRDDPSEALGAPDSTFVSLGYGGTLVLGFAQSMSGSLSLSVHETTGGSYPLETAEVAVSQSPTGPWTVVGTADNDEGTGDGVRTFTDITQCFQYVRIVDTTDEDLHNNNSDGFDVDAVSSEYSQNCERDGNDNNDTTVINNNEGSIDNKTYAGANTGGNYAGGSEGGSGGRGGDIYAGGRGGDHDVDDSTTGDGGNGGSGGAGGTVQTGDASASAETVNVLNSNVTRVNRCGCDGDGDNNDTAVRNRNEGSVDNYTGSKANTGLNKAKGSTGGNGGRGGDIDAYGGESEVDDADTGNGGRGGNSGPGGLIVTGNASAWSETVNNVNSNRTRIDR